MGNEINNRWLEAASIRDWLDKQIKMLEEQRRSYKFNDFVECYYPGHEIPLRDGIVYIANLLMIELTEESRNDTGYPFRYSFSYAGFTFYQIAKERLIGEDSDGNETLADKERAS